MATSFWTRRNTKSVRRLRSHMCNCSKPHRNPQIGTYGILESYTNWNNSFLQIYSFLRVPMFNARTFRIKLFLIHPLEIVRQYFNKRNNVFSGSVLLQQPRKAIFQPKYDERDFLSIWLHYNWKRVVCL